MDQTPLNRKTRTARGAELRATDPIWKRDEVESPCVKLCAVHPTEGICIGCFRTLAEIAGWTAMTPEARRAVTAELSARSLLLRRRRGGRATRLAE